MAEYSTTTRSFSFSRASSDATAVDPALVELQPLIDALVALKIGVQKTCAAIAVSLSQESVMSIEDLQLLSEAQVLDVLGRAGMTELQQVKLMRAVTPLHADGQPFVCLGSKSFVVDNALCKKAGLTAAQFLKKTV
jgi:hypothetical protein